MTDCPVYVVHLSTRLGLERIKQAQSIGQRVWTETCPQYLLLNENEMERLGPLAKMDHRCVPRTVSIRTRCGRAPARDTSPTSVATTPRPRKKANKPGWQNIFRSPDGEPIPFGAPSLETIVPLVYSEGVAKRGLPIWWMARVLAENPRVSSESTHVKV